MTADDQKPFARICLRCARKYPEAWRVGCPRCGGQCVSVEAGRNKEAKSRAWKDGWTPDAEARSPSLSKKRQQESKR